MPEIRRLITRFQVSTGLCLDFILSWSLWRRVHQAVAKACHWQRQAAKLLIYQQTRGYMPRLMSPIPEINGYITLLKDTGPAARISGPCKQLALRVLERMGLSLFSFKAQQSDNALAQ
jgi:hypothetical protein